MAKPEIYFKSWCPYCQAALALLDAKGIDYTPIDVTVDAVREAEMRDRAGRTSVPQIFVGDLHLGGFDDINALERQGQLDDVLAGKATA